MGTPIQATDRSGIIVWSAQYNAFGKVSITTPTATDDKPVIASSLRFPGQVEDAETGLYYNWHRYYDPELGRYVTADPIGLMGGVNFYAYVKSNPINEADPFGLRPAGCQFIATNRKWDPTGVKDKQETKRELIQFCWTYPEVGYPDPLPDPENPGKIKEPVFPEDYISLKLRCDYLNLIKGYRREKYEEIVSGFLACYDKCGNLTDMVPSGPRKTGKVDWKKIEGSDYTDIEDYHETYASD